MRVCSLLPMSDMEMMVLLLPVSLLASRPGFSPQCVTRGYTVSPSRDNMRSRALTDTTQSCLSTIFRVGSRASPPSEEILYSLDRSRPAAVIIIPIVEPSRLRQRISALLHRWPRATTLLIRILSELVLAVLSTVLELLLRSRLVHSSPTVHITGRLLCSVSAGLRSGEVLVPFVLLSIGHIRRIVRDRDRTLSTTAFIVTSIPAQHTFQRHGIW